MEHHRTRASDSRHQIGRFTSIEGWRDVSNGVYLFRNAVVRLVAVKPASEVGVDDKNEKHSLLAQARDASSSGTASNTGIANRQELSGDSFGLRPEHDSHTDISRAGTEPSESHDIPDGPYHVFCKKQKWFVIVIIGVAGLFSGLSSNIYFPALDAISKDLNISAREVSLTITSYLVVQGISPLFWGSLSDVLGRRPIYIASFTVYIIANIVLSSSPNFAVLLIFRGLQAAGSASTVSIGNGVIQDISPPSERGAFICIYQAIRNFSIAVGPVLGGVIADRFGFRAIFVFLLIISSITVLFIIGFLPETMRCIVGNGSTRPTGIYRPVVYSVRREPFYWREPSQPTAVRRIKPDVFIEPLKLLRRRDIVVNLLLSGVVYAVWSMVTSSTTGLFKATFNLNETLLGLAFLPNGIGTIVGSTIIGRYMTRDYASAEQAYKTAHCLPPTHSLSARDLPPGFPIEHARQRRLPLVITLFSAAIAAYGFTFALSQELTLYLPVHPIALPLALQFVIAATSSAVFAMNQALVSDLSPGRGAGSTAVNNLVRCGLGAVGVAGVESMIAALGPAATFLALALVTVCLSPLVAVSRVRGPEWRMHVQQGQGKGVREKV